MMTAWGLTFKFYTSRQQPAMRASDPQPKPRRFREILSSPCFDDFPGKSMNRRGK